jgi:hypothetical protein
MQKQRHLKSGTRTQVTTEGLGFVNDRPPLSLSCKPQPRCMLNFGKNKPLGLAPFGDANEY